MSNAYYNENDPKAAAWLRELIKAGLIAPGEVDERSIEDVIPTELAGYTQCHFFAGVGVWSYALRRAGWPDDRRVWTGSCPCQPFSAAGQRKGTSDERHLWPAWFHLIRIGRPDVVFGEQVESKDGRAWLDTVQDDMEAIAFTFGALGLCASGVGAPHIRPRLFFVADSLRSGRAEGRAESRDRQITGSGGARRMADSENQRHERDRESRRRGDGLTNNGTVSGLANANGRHASAEGIQRSGQYRQWAQDCGAVNGFWRDAGWIDCQDGKLRPTQPGVFPLANGVAARMAKLRGIGNAIVAPLAEEFIKAYLEINN